MCYRGSQLKASKEGYSSPLVEGEVLLTGIEKIPGGWGRVGEQDLSGP